MRKVVRVTSAGHCRSWKRKSAVLFPLHSQASPRQMYAIQEEGPQFGEVVPFSEVVRLRRNVVDLELGQSLKRTCYYRRPR